MGVNDEDWRACLLVCGGTDYIVLNLSQLEILRQGLDLKSRFLGRAGLTDLFLQTPLGPEPVVFDGLR